MTDFALVHYDAACRELAEARAIDEVRQIMDKATALRVYYKQAQNGQAAADAAEIQLRARRRAGEILTEMRVSGQRRGQGGSHKRTDGIASLDDLGISDSQSSRYQKLGALAQADFERRVAAMRDQVIGAIDTTPEERKLEKQQRRAAHEANLARQIRELPTKKFGVILADPEWRFIPWNEETGSDRSAANHYATGRLEDIKARDVPSISADDCVLFLWATVPMLGQALEVMEYWKFKYKSHFVWLKDKMATGYWSRNIHELLLIGTVGDPPAPAMGTQYMSAWDAPVGEHSEKPAFVYELIETYYPTMPKIELNARKKREGWEAWGAEAPLDLESASAAE